MEEDSESDESELGDFGEYYAKRMRLRLQLRRWEAKFVALHGRHSAYEDKKVDREYQSLRSQLRALELAWKTAIDGECCEDVGSTWRSGTGVSARTGLSSRRSAGSAATSRMSIVER